MRFSEQLCVGVSVIAIMTGCNISDTQVTRQPGEPCTNPGVRAGELVCESGVWTLSPALDMSRTDSSDGDAEMTFDAQMEDLACEGETDAELCALLRRCALEMSVVDRCDKVRNVVCDGTCAVGICITTTGVCEGDCMPSVCPAELVCGRVSNGCGAMQLCDACPTGEVCNPDEQKCQCAPPDPTAVCVDVCGEVMVDDTCDSSVAVDCGACLAGRCAENICVLLEVIAPKTASPGARFGASLDVDGNMLIVGAPGDGEEYKGNAEIFERDDQTRGWSSVYDVRGEFEDTSIYNGYVMGVSVAISASLNLAFVGKSLDIRKLPFAPSIGTVQRTGGSWREGELLNGTGRDFGFRTATAGPHVFVSSPRESNSTGVLGVFNFERNSFDYMEARTYTGKEEADLAGFGLDISATQLAYGSPGSVGQTGECRTARLAMDNVTWSDARVLGANSPKMGAQFCRTVALGPGLLAASFNGRAVGGKRFDVVQVFTSNDNGLTWDFFQEIADPQEGSDGGFGASIVFASKNVLIIGDPFQKSETGIKEAGAVYIYAPDASGVYGLVQEVRSSSPEDSGHFGAAISTFEGLVMIGAPDEDYEQQINSGVVYEFTLD